MSTLIVYAADVAAICLLVFALYVPRHGRRDLVVAYLGVNIGVMAVASALLDSAVGAGLGLGLFGVLSIIRLRSEELAQHEVAYYFAALALGLLSGLAVGPVWLPVALMALIVGALWLGDHPRMLSRHRRRVVVLDRAYDDERDVATALEKRLGGPVIGVTVLKVDHVNDSTTVDVRFRVPVTPASAPDAAAPVRRTTVLVP
ncbi:DUF4956 domain-containing protein [Phycicoccus avicenniae]|uniref:DUF4956 domain-containing protein n=1 Tax=Phycicoccus avicenniae TaxID=2828860 RepID=UPI003D281F25